MALTNEAEVKKIIIKLYKAVDNNYVDFIKGTHYNYACQLIDNITIDSVINVHLSEEELNILTIALSEDELEVNRIIAENASFIKFFKKITDATTNYMAKGILRAYTIIKQDKKNKENVEKLQREKRELFKAAKLTARQKQVLDKIGISLTNFENKNAR